MYLFRAILFPFLIKDANECWTELIRCMQKKLPAIGEGEVGVINLI